MLNCIEKDLENANKDIFTILNYQGSKKKLIDFIHKNVNSYIDVKKPILDIFAGTCSVGYSFKGTHTVYANDCEYYAYLISKALLGDYKQDSLEDILADINIRYEENYSKLKIEFKTFYKLEDGYLSCGDIDGLIALYSKFPTIWNKQVLLNSKSNNYDLFSTYYACNYFGIKQGMQIDSLRYAIESYSDTNMFPALMASLFYAMKECVFSKDGHMAQPLDGAKNKLKLQKQRERSIYANFIGKLSGFFSPSFVKSRELNKAFNCDFKTLLCNREIQEKVGFIYADPPYTDMQYSRYYHLLNIVAKYNYPKPTTSLHGFTSGLYTENRFQSDLSRKSSCLNSFTNLITFSKEYNKNLAISFAYPKDVEIQKTDRYVMSIEQIEKACIETFGRSNVDIVSVDYLHSNNRNAATKKVLEYLVLCKN